MSTSSSLVGDDTEASTSDESDSEDCKEVDSDSSQSSVCVEQATEHFSAVDMCNDSVVFLPDCEDEHVPVPNNDLNESTASAESFNSDGEPEAAEVEVNVETGSRGSVQDENEAFIACFDKLSPEDKTIMCMRVLQCVRILENQDDREGTFV
jgi:hypothetical protein